MFVSKITEKWTNGFSWYLQDMLDFTPGPIWNILVMWCFTSWKYYLFQMYGPVFVSDIMEAEWDFLKFSEYVGYDIRNKWLNCFTPVYCFTFVKQGGAEVSALGVLLIFYMIFLVHYLLRLVRMITSEHDNNKPCGYHMGLLACGYCQVLFPIHPSGAPIYEIFYGDIMNTTRICRAHMPFWLFETNLVPTWTPLCTSNGCLRLKYWEYQGY